MKLCLISLILTAFISTPCLSQQTPNTTDARLRRHVYVLADDSLEGRRAGTIGEERASKYIISQFKATGLKPKGSKNSYLQPFTIPDGLQIASTTHFIVQGKSLHLDDHFYPASFSGSGKAIASVVNPTTDAGKNIIFLDLETVLKENIQNIHAEYSSIFYEKSLFAQKKGAIAVIWYHSGQDYTNVPRFNPKSNQTLLNIPILFLTKEGQKYLGFSNKASYDIDLFISINKRIRIAHNVIGFLDKKAPFTMIIGAHYDHLGRGEDGNSMSKQPNRSEIHNGADDNASGTAALLELAYKLSKNHSYLNFNILFIAFSGEELGLLGSRYFTEHPTIDLSKTQAMINMDMVGRLNQSNLTMTLGGYGTSPSWSQILTKVKTNIKLKYDSSGTGPSDHTSFYRKNIPVIFLFTGLHDDYHRPSDDAEKIYYRGVSMIVDLVSSIVYHTEADKKIEFSPTRERQTTTSARFTVSLGIMPDYSFDGQGVRVDGVSEGKIAQKAGILAGDILISLGQGKIQSVESYMQLLSKFRKGDNTTVSILRNGQELIFDIIF